MSDTTAARHTEPDYHGQPSLGCLVALALSGALVLAATGIYWFFTSL